MYNINKGIQCVINESKSHMMDSRKVFNDSTKADNYYINRDNCDDERTSLLTAYESNSIAKGQNDMDTREEILEPSWYLSKRWQVCFPQVFLLGLAFLGCFFLYSLRVDLSVAIVCMCNETGKNSSAGLGDEQSEFSWGERTRSSLLSAYFYGYLLLQVPGGWLAGRYGATRVISLAMTLSAICTLLMSLPAFYALRVATGLFAGSVTPSFQALWGRWAPPQERTRLAGFAYSGGYLGSITTFSLSGVLCDHGFDGGWPSIFYIFGTLALLWTLLWFFVVYDSPSNHPTISREEKEYITSSLQDKPDNNPRLPWLKMFTSAPFWALIVAIVAMAWVDYTFITSLPQYLKDVLDFDISEDGFLSATPSVCQFVSSLLVGPVADKIQNRGVGTGAVRKIFQSITFLGIAVCLTSVGYVTYDKRYLAVCLLGLSGFFAGMQQAGYVANFIDIAPRFAGVMYGVGNSIATVSGIVSPIVVGKITSGKSRQEWQTVFFVCAGISVLAAILYDCFAQGQVQTWAVEVTAELDGGGSDVSYIDSINSSDFDQSVEKRDETRRLVNS